VAREQRRLAAIVAADVVGYSRLMGRNESGTVARLKQNRAERLDPILAKYGSRLVKLTGDGALVEFPSCRCARRGHRVPSLLVGRDVLLSRADGAPSLTLGCVEARGSSF